MPSRLTAPMRTTGTVKWFHEGKSFGFIGRDDGLSDCFVHRFDLHDETRHTLAAGDRVAFDVIEDVNGPAAENVTSLPPFIH
jgi:CspA family cold shock protein